MNHIFIVFFVVLAHCSGLGGAGLIGGTGSGGSGTGKQPSNTGNFSCSGFSISDLLSNSTINTSKLSQKQRKRILKKKQETFSTTEEASSELAAHEVSDKKSLSGKKPIAREIDSTIIIDCDYSSSSSSSSSDVLISKSIKHKKTKKCIKKKTIIISEEDEECSSFEQENPAPAPGKKKILKKNVIIDDDFDDDDIKKSLFQKKKNIIHEKKKKIVKQYRKEFPSLSASAKNNPYDSDGSGSSSSISDIDSALLTSFKVPDCPINGEVEKEIKEKLTKEGSLGRSIKEIRDYCNGLPHEFGKSPILKGDRRTKKSHLKISTFNCRFLFINSPTKAAAKKINFPWKSEADLDSHIKYISAIIEKLDSDIIILNEVQDYSSIEMVRLLLPVKQRNLYRSYYLKGRDYTTEMNVGLLTKVDPVEDLDDFEHQQEELVDPDGNVTPVKVAKGLVAKFAVSDMDGRKEMIAIIGLHLIRSDPVNPALNLFREGQARIVVQKGKKLLLEGYKVIVVGDMNDNDKVALSSKDQSSLIKFDASKIVRSSALAMMRTGLVLRNAFESFAHQYIRASTVGNSMIDHILCDHRLKIHSNHILQPQMHPITFFYVTTPFSSDHFPITATIKL